MGAKRYDWIPIVSLCPLGSFAEALLLYNHRDLRSL
jgi:hypothetical protein